MWILIPVILGILVIQLSILFLFILRRRKKKQEKEGMAVMFDFGEEYPEGIEQEISIPRPNLKYYRNPNPNLFENNFPDQGDMLA